MKNIIKQAQLAIFKVLSFELSVTSTNNMIQTELITKVMNYNLVVVEYTKKLKIVHLYIFMS
jgi:hypothetical protein